MSNVTKLSDAIKFALFVGAASSAASVSALAQNAAATEEATTLDRVEVTGSRIKKVDSETAQPVTVITRADIEKTGVTNVYDLLQAVTASDGSGLSNVTTQTNGSDGSQYVSLRGLGSQRTLVLVDGKRWPVNVNGQSDLSTIPLAIIERIDILKDGASATYGSDAIAGVVNLITRKNYEGAQVGLQYGQFDPGDGANTAFDFTIGAAGERTSGVISMSYTDQESVFAADRKISSVPLWGNSLYGRVYDGNRSDCMYYLNNPNNFPGAPLGNIAACGSGSGQYGLFQLQSGSGVSSNQAFSKGGVNYAGVSYAPGDLSNGFQAADYARRDSTYLYNFAPINYLYQPSERYNIFAAGRVELTDNVSAYTRLTYSKRQSSQQLAEVPLTISIAGNNGPQWAFGMAADSIYNPWGVGSSLIPGSATTCSAATGCQINSINYRMSPLGPRRSNIDQNNLAINLGLEGSFEIGDRYFAWDVDYQYNDLQQSDFGENYVNLFNLKNALGSSGYDPVSGEFFCGKTYATRIKGCVPFFVTGGPTLGLGANILGNGNGAAVGAATRQVTAADVAQMLNYVGYDLNSQFGSSSDIFNGNLSGDLFELPAGMWSFAIGFDNRKNDAYVNPDSLVAEGGSSTNFTLPTRGEQSISEYYIELDMPLLKDIFLIQQLDVTYAYRDSTYSSKGYADPDPTDANVETEFIQVPDIGAGSNFVGVKWKPIDDLLVRYTWGESFRAPTIGDLFAGTAEGFPAATDQCNMGLVDTNGDFVGDTPRYFTLDPASQLQCDNYTGLSGTGVNQPFGQIRGLFGSSPYLQPESGKNETIGLVWSPSFLEGFEMSIDYWKIELDNAISTYSLNFIIQQCILDLDNNFCQFIQRDTYDAVTNPSGTGNINVVNALPFNLAGYRTAGYDISMSYNFDGGASGNWSFNIDSTYTDYFETKAFTTSDWVDSVGRYLGSPTPEWKSNFYIDWNLGDWGASWVTRTMSDVWENCFFYCNDQGEANGQNHTGFYAVHDLQVRWTAPWDATFSVGKRNLFDKEPPVLTNNTFAHSFDAAYDIPGGGYWYMSYRQDF